MAAGVRLSRAEIDNLRLLRERADELLRPLVDRWCGAGSAASFEVSQPLAGKCVLVVDGDAEAARAAAALLGSLGFTPRHVDQAAGALELLEAGARFCVVMAADPMPGMTGQELADEIRRRWPSLPVFIVTGRSLPCKLPQLQSPYTGRQLLEMIERLQREHDAFPTGLTN